MSTREYFTKTFRREWPVFVKVLRAIPEGQIDYKPHERSSAAGDIAWFLVNELGCLNDAIESGRSDFPEAPRAATLDEIISAYEAQARELEQRVSTIDDERWLSEAGMYFRDKLIRNYVIEDLCWDFLHDAIHHRGQLSAYLRPMGGKVPSIYGPSGDEKGSL
jgi:uncharacterized damage-inducible protein DinB